MVEKKVYGSEVMIKVTPVDRSEDVLYFLTTGQLLGGRSLKGVTYEYVEGSGKKSELNGG